MLLMKNLDLPKLSFEFCQVNKLITLGLIVLFILNLIKTDILIKKYNNIYSTVRSYDLNIYKITFVLLTKLVVIYMWFSYI